MKFINSNTRLNYLLACLLCFVAFSSIKAQSTSVKIDFNQSGRSESQVLETGYEAWATYADPISNTYNGITFTLSKYGDNGTGLKSNWYKEGVTTAKLVSDGVVVEDGNDGGAILLTISNLSAGEHSLLVFLNNVDSPDGNTFCPMDIYVNDELIEDNLILPTRVTSNYDAKIIYLTFSVEEGENIEVLFKADVEAGSSTNIKNVIINAIELDSPNLLDQATEPYPEDNNEHVEDEEDVELSWISDDEAVSHNVYFSSDYDEISSATTSSESFKGNQTQTIYNVSNLDSHLTYYWRIDEIKEDGTVTLGNVWSFRTVQIAFPGAEGYGRYARGGRDGKVVHVTNLDDSGEGSLRYAIEDITGPRTIVFDVSGIIELGSRLTLSDDYVTVAGQTAPGRGICIRNAPFGLSGANDVIIQHIRVRRGDSGDYNWGLDGMGMQGSNNCIIDHCSISWTIDEAFSSRSGENISLQRTFISEALNIAGHPNYPEGTMHGYAGSIGGDVGSFHHNLLAHCEGRNWSLAGGLDGNAYYAGRLDIRNNVVYNWGHRATDGGTMELNFVGNYYKPGEATDQFYALIIDHEGTGLGTQRAYFDGNVMPGYFDENNQEDGCTYRISNDAEVDWETFVDEPFFESYVNTQTATAAYKDVLSDVGCTQPCIDFHDQRVIDESLNGTYKYSGSISGKPGLPDKVSDTEGYEYYGEENRESDWDTDGDGLPDWWEEYYNLDPNSAENDFSDSNSDVDGDGYTQLDEYLQWMSKQHYFKQIDQSFAIDLSFLFKGYTNIPVYSVLEEINGVITIEDGIATIQPSSCGMANFKFKVTDADGDSKEKEVVAFFLADSEGNCNSETTAIGTEIELIGDSIYVIPNPVEDDVIYISGYKKNATINSIKLLNLQGKILKNYRSKVLVNGEYRQEFDLPNLKSGVYFVEVEFEDEKQIVRFVKS